MAKSRATCLASCCETKVRKPSQSVQDAFADFYEAVCSTILDDCQLLHAMAHDKWNMEIAKAQIKSGQIHF